LDAVGREYVPPTLDPVRLREGIDTVGAQLKIKADEDSNPRRAARQERLQRLAQSATDLHQLLSDEDGKWASRSLASAFPIGERARKKRGVEAAPSLAGLKAGLVRLQRVAAREFEAVQAAKAAWHGRWSPRELSVITISKIFDEHFDDPAKYTKALAGDERADSPRIRFIEAVLADQRLPEMARNSIAQALTNHVKGRSRRKKPSTPKLPLP
jgi:hypothetical protein